MNESSKDRLSFVILLFGIAFLAFSYGIVAGIWQLPPSEGVRSLYKNITDITYHWKNDLGFRPTRTLVKGYGADRPHAKVIDPSAMAPGNVLIGGLAPHRETLNTVVLYDRNGNEIHAWPFNYEQLDPDGPGSLHVIIHGLALFRDGSIIVNFDGGHVLTRISACGDIIWSIEGKYHHAISHTHDGSIWSLRGDMHTDDGPELVQINPENGEIIKTFSLLGDLLHDQNLQGIMAIRTQEDPDKLEYLGDTLHINHVEALGPDKAKAFPMFETGDLLISLRSLNLVAVIDGDTARLKWHQIGPWYRQHNPHYQQDGTIMVYNNNMSFNNSSIMSVNPADNSVKTLFRGTDEQPFYSWRRGKAERLPNNNILIAESEKGRVIEVTPAGEVVWEYNNIYDEQSNGVVTSAIHVPKNFFNKGALNCPSAE